MHLPNTFCVGQNNKNLKKTFFWIAFPNPALARYFSPSTTFSSGRTRTPKPPFRKLRLSPNALNLWYTSIIRNTNAALWVITETDGNLMVKQSRAWTRAQVQSCWKQQCRRILATSNPGRRDRLASSGDLWWKTRIFVGFHRILCRLLETGATAFPKRTRCILRNDKNPPDRISDKDPLWRESQIFKMFISGAFHLWLPFSTPVSASTWTMTVFPAIRWRWEKSLEKSRTSLNGTEEVQRRAIG